MPTPNRPTTDKDVAARRSSDEAVLAEMTAPPGLEEAQESLGFWRQRLAELPVYRRAERREAQEAVERWEGLVRDAERARYGPSLIEEVLGALGVRWRPRPRRVLAGLGVLAVVLVALVIALAVAIVVFWPEIAPIVRTLLGNGEGGGGEG